MDSFRTMIVPAQHVDLARQLAASFGPGGEGMWTTALSKTGSDPAASYISTGYVPEEYAVLMPLQVWELDENQSWQETSSTPGDPVAIYQLASSQGVACTQEQVTALLADVDVTEQEPFTALDRLQLKIISPPFSE